MELTVKVISNAAVKQIRESLGARARRRVLTAVAQRLKEMTQENFGPDGPWRTDPWPPYQNDYPSRGKYEGEPATLIETGKLLNSIYVHVNDQYAEVGSDVEYADVHQFGGGNMPQRPFFPITGSKVGFSVTQEVRDELEKVASAALIEEFRR